jgi:hypothetical protein
MMDLRLHSETITRPESLPLDSDRRNGGASMADSPEILHNYQNHHLDSTRWESYRPRSDDIVASTSYKSGTTWMQAILVNLVFQGRELPDVFDTSPWIGMRIRPLDPVIETLEAQQHRRVIKSHLPLDGLPFYHQVKYLVVGRDARDVFMSLWNHYRNYTEKFVADLNAGQVGAAFPVCPDDIHLVWRRWISQGWFDWESEGYPFWSNLHHTRTWWAYRQLPNILFVHFNDLQGVRGGRRRGSTLGAPTAPKSRGRRTRARGTRRSGSTLGAPTAPKSGAYGVPMSPLHFGIAERSPSFHGLLGRYGAPHRRQ